MPTKDRIAYLMHVDWNWIKQRPHFIYEEMTKHFNVDLFFIRKLYMSHKLAIQNSREVYSDSNVNRLIKIPLSGRFGGFRLIERMINWKSLRSLKKYDYIWITSPLILDFAPLYLFEGKTVIYDCMDDFLGFYSGTKKIHRLKKLETSLVRRADIIFTSSNYLKGKMISLYQNDLRMTPVVVNNGISPLLIKKQPTTSLPQKNIDTSSHYLNLMYIGTIGEWIDFELIQSILLQTPNVKVTMVGPLSTKIMIHSRIEYVGAVEHDQLPAYARLADAFIMPFKLNELVRAVDPVKIYEYISFGRPVIAVDYEEMDKFLPFVYLYADEAELLDLVDELQRKKLKVYSETETAAFLEHNTWDVRCERIIQALKGVR